MRQVREAAAPYQAPIEAQPSRSNAIAGFLSDDAGTSSVLRPRKAFVAEFMNPKYREQSQDRGRTYAEILYGQFRCGLAHGFSIEGHEVATRPDEYIVDEGGYVSIDLWTLFEDLEAAFEVYVSRVRSAADVQSDFERRFNQIFVHPY